MGIKHIGRSITMDINNTVAISDTINSDKEAAKGETNYMNFNGNSMSNSITSSSNNKNAGISQ